jgi:hypothetical protein
MDSSGRRLAVRLGEPRANAGEVNESEVVSRRYFITSAEPTKSFEPMEEHFDKVTKSVELLVGTPDDLASRVRFDHRLHAEQLDQIAQGGGVVAFVGDAT